MKKQLMLLLAILLLTGCTSGSTETEPFPTETSIEESRTESLETIPEPNETANTPDRNNENKIYTTSDLDQILYEDESCKLAVYQGKYGIFTSDGHLTAWLYGVDEADFCPDESGILPEEQRTESEHIHAGLRFTFRIPKTHGVTVTAEYVLYKDNEWFTYFTAEESTDTHQSWYFYKSEKHGYYREKSPKTDYNYGIFTLHSVYTPENADSEVLKLSNDFYIHDGSWYHYNLTDGSKTHVPFLPDDCSYFNVVTADGDILGYSVQNKSGLSAFYSLKDEKYLTDFELNNIYATNSRDYIAVSIPVDSTEENNGYDYKYGILNLKTGEIFGFDRTHGKVAMSVDAGGNSTFFRASDHFDTMSGYYVYTEDMTLISEETFSHTSVTADGNLLAIPYHKYDKPTQFRVYSKNGELIKTSREYDRVLFVCRDWIYAADNGKLCLFDADENLVVEFAEWSDKTYIHWMLSGYKKESPAQIDAEDPYKYYYYEGNENGEYIEKETATYPEGLYFLTEDESIDYGVTGRAKEYIYSPETRLVGKLEWGEVGGYAKPVLYLYPEETADITVTFSHPELLTTVYPAYHTAWNVTAEPDGTLTDNRGREYYALYWEESGSIPVDFETGFCVPRENAAAFLEEKLDHLGLTNREANEMIMYWLPVMEKNEFSLVYFELTESRETYNSLNITPAPDSLLRIAIHIRPSDEYMNIEEQALPAWNRTGFAAVEWGGVIHR